jgi:hypothetical protein
MTIYSQKKIKTPTTKLAPRTAGADYPIWLVRASSYPASALRFHRTSQAAARSGDARPAARRAPRRNAIGGLTADHRVVFGRLHDRPIRMARQAAAPGEIAAARPSRERGSARSAAPACRRAVRAESRGCGSPQCARLGSLGECRHRSDVGDGGGVTARSPGRGAVTGSGGVRSAERHAAGKRFRPLTPPFFSGRFR